MCTARCQRESRLAGSAGGLHEPTGLRPDHAAVIGTVGYDLQRRMTGIAFPVLT
jgi:hypothetical protein